ncbi:MAG: hypothetical protein HQL33_11895, partial [Alphaproteobacteria bacterium]|nr:hypothetical protein [Alphaproteobacteria bacterium]
MTVFETLSLTSRLPLAVLVGLGGAAAVLVLAGVLRRGRGAAARAGAVLALFLALLDPRLTEEARQPRDDVAVVVVDDSPSQAIGDRRRQTEAALAALLDRLKAQERLSVRVERLGAGENFDDGTRLFAAVRRATADVPRGRLGGVALITDGQVHDGPPREWGGPVHVLLTGRPDEGDRRLVVGRPPGYGIVGKSVPVAVTVEDRGGDGAPANAVLTVRRDGGAARTLTVPVGRTYVFQADISHGGANVLEFEVEPGPAELSLANNRAAVTIGGVRDRLKVLLLSGRPHPGERTWRNLLKADANVDLVHFTILRPIDKDDFTPLNELALIAFPMRELFEEKLGDFDLVIFDRFGVHNPLPDAYLENVVRYVRKGGA